MPIMPSMPGSGTGVPPEVEPPEVEPPVVPPEVVPPEVVVVVPPEVVPPEVVVVVPPPEVELVELVDPPHLPPAPLCPQLQ